MLKKEIQPKRKVSFLLVEFVKELIIKRMIADGKASLSVIIASGLTMWRKITRGSRIKHRQKHKFQIK